MTFITILAKTVRDRVRGERSCKSKRWIHTEMLAKQTVNEGDEPDRYIDEKDCLPTQAEGLQRHQHAAQNLPQPTLTERPGLPVRIIVNRDLVLRPYQPLFFNRGASR